MTILLLAFLFPFTVAYLVLSLVINPRDPAPQWAVSLMKGSLAMGLAFGLSSCTFFLWLIAVGGLTQHYLVTEALVFSGLAAALFHAVKTTVPSLSWEHPQASLLNTTLNRVLLVSLALVLATRLTRFVFLSLNNPHGDVDALGIWNLRARFLFAGGDRWRESFAMLLDRNNTADYPLLLPTTVARFWSYLGEDSTLVPAGVALLFTFAIIGLTLSALAILRTRSQGFLAALVLVGTPFLIKHGASQYADVPLAFFMLATLVLLCLQDRSEDTSHRLMILAGVTSGFAAWTKNEGLLFVATIIVARLFVTVPQQGWKSGLKQLLAFATGLFPVLAIVVYFKIQIAPTTTLMVSQGFDAIIAKLQNSASYLEVGKAFSGKIFRPGYPGLVLLIIYFALLGVPKERGQKASIAAPATVLFLMFVGYFFIFVATPFLSIRYQLDTALDRLWLHLWPSAVFVFFLFVKTPEEAMAPRGVSSTER